MPRMIQLDIRGIFLGGAFIFCLRWRWGKVR